jgi:hypothetical protein
MDADENLPRRKDDLASTPSRSRSSKSASRCSKPRSPEAKHGLNAPLTIAQALTPYSSDERCTGDEWQAHKTPVLDRDA